jgi:AcrR family transcriptional regulator
MANDQEMKQRIESKAQEMFYRYGYSRVTMEEIASTLGISKKTLYKHFSNKEHLLKEIVHKTKCEIEAFVNKLIEDDKTEFVVKRFYTDPIQ